MKARFIHLQLELDRHGNPVHGVIWDSTDDPRGRLLGEEHFSPFDDSLDVYRWAKRVICRPLQPPPG